MSLITRSSLLRSSAILALLLSASFVAASAQGGVINPVNAPEVDPSLVGGGLAVLTGAALLIRRKRKV